jgi:hypothetical protein
MATFCEVHHEYYHCYQYLSSVHDFRYLFFVEVSDWELDLPTTSVFRTDLDGTGRKHVGSFRSMFASGLALDMVRRRLYISNQFKHTIECATYEGRDKYTVASAEVRCTKY